MYIYTKNIPLTNLTQNEDSSFAVLCKNFNGFKMYNLAFPHCITGDVPISSILQNEAIREYFLTADMVITPEFEGKRRQGEYQLGDAKAELVKRKGKLKLTISCSNFDSLEDMESLRKKIYANQIKPAIPYRMSLVEQITASVSSFRKSKKVQ